MMDDDADIRTERLLLRRWRDSDRDGWAAMCADPEVMRWFPAPLTREQADASIDRIDAHFDEHGYGLWAVERIEESDFIGFLGLNMTTWEAAFTPAVEIGWRLARHAWGRGYATEAATAVVEHAFTTLGLEEIISLTVPANEPSWNVMRKLGMTHDPGEDFDHPNIADGHPLQRHVLYRLARG